MTRWDHRRADRRWKPFRALAGGRSTRQGLRSGAVDEGPTMEKLSQILWRERELLETLLFKLEEEQMVLAPGRTRWLVRAAREVDNVLDTIRETEMLRAIAADEVAEELGLGHNPSLRSLADAVEEPWHSLLADHHDAFTTATQEVM